MVLLFSKFQYLEIGFVLAVLVIGYGIYRLGLSLKK